METIHMKYPHVKTLRRLYTLLCQMVHFGHNAHLMLALREGERGVNGTGQVHKLLKCHNYHERRLTSSLTLNYTTGNVLSISTLAGKD